ncbi:MAG: histidine kinase [Bryobacteraceae bacterium]|nr:histidine kinase [Bryobacteraceae bacterium]MDW8379249.1 histidine kinase [Bryobacterales bacterium]
MLEEYLVILFVKLAVSASLASIFARPAAIQRLLLLEERTLSQRLRLALAFTIVFGTGVAIRVVSRNNYQAVDIGLEGALLAGLVAGYVTGLVSGLLISLPAMLLNGELLSMPLFAGLGVMGGLLRDLAPDKEEIWRFSPFFDLGWLRLVRKQATYRHVFFQHVCLASILFAEFLRFNLAHNFGAKYLFVIYPGWPDAHLLTVAATYGTTVFTVTLPLKVWNTIRVERKLESQQVLLTEARLAALARQINPHFLFNTLNSISTLVRLDPDQARNMIQKLASIMRRLLRKQENVTPLREELAFIDDYLSIEVVRFGDKLKIEKKIDPSTLDCAVPSMLLQPLVENSIKHGLSSKVEGGRIWIESALANGMLLIAVEDDGVGIAEDRLATLFEQGIGISNVNERLKVLYGNEFRFSVMSKVGEGTRTEIEIPATVFAAATPPALPSQPVAASRA